MVRSYLICVIVSMTDVEKFFISPHPSCREICGNCDKYQGWERFTRMCNAYKEELILLVSLENISFSISLNVKL